MAQRTWKGGATAVQQVWSGTITAVANTNTFTLTMTDEAGGTAQVVFTAGVSDTTTTAAAGLVALVNASTDPRFMAVTASNVTNVLTLKADNNGVPFYVAATTSGGTWSSTGNTTKNQGPNDWNTQANWVENVVPVNGDNVTFTGNNPINYGLQTGLALGAVNTVQGTTSANGGRGLRLSFTCTSFYYAGNGLSFFDLGSSAIAPRIVGTANATAPACGLYIKGSALTTCNVEGGSVDFVGLSGETATATTINVMNGARVKVGSGMTLTNYNQENGTNCELGCAATTVTTDSGTLTTVGAGAIGTMNVNGGTCYPESSGTITNLNVNNGTCDLTASAAPRTVTTPKVAPGGKLLWDPAVVTMTNPPSVPSNLGPMQVAVTVP